MGVLKFTQYIRPNGRKKEVLITISNEVAEMGVELQQSGWELSVEAIQDEARSDEEKIQMVDARMKREVLPYPSNVFLDVCNGEDSLANELVRNGPAVVEAVERLVRSAHARMKKRETND